MPLIKLFMAPVRWNHMLLLCHRGRAVTRLKHGRPLLPECKVLMERAGTLLGHQQTQDGVTRARPFPCDIFLQSVQTDDNGSVGWSKCGQSLRCCPQFTHPVLMPLCTPPWHLWLWPEYDLFFCPCHALVLNTNAMVLCARHSWEQALLFLATCPQLHISNPGANVQLVFVSNSGRQCRNLPNTNRHLDKSCLCPVLKPCRPSIHLSLCRCWEALLPNICSTDSGNRGTDLFSHTTIDERHIM